MSILHLPEFDLDPALPVTSSVIDRGVGSFQEAAEYIRDLPYGRNSDRADYRLVMPEGRGTCSTKHALMAALALEHGVSVSLVLGLYEMSGLNTPGVGATLKSYGLESIPEAHCYLRYGKNRIDLTRNVEAPETIGYFLHEENISPEDIGEYKVELHQRLLMQWADKQKRGFSEIWTAREECIRAIELLPATSIPASRRS